MKNDPGSIGEFRSLRLHKRLHDQAARLARIGAWECDLATERLTWTDGVYDLFGLPIGSPLKRSTIVNLYDEESRSDMEALRSEAIRTGGGFTIDSRIRTVRGESRWMRLRAEAVQEDGRPVRLFGAKQDITGEREAWERLRRLAEHDALTGLANRGVFEARYREVVDGGLRQGGVAALVLIDLDGFKQVNDAFGHAAGDECLRQAAARLTRSFADAVLVSRIGGDEFAILLRAPLGRSRIVGMLERAAVALCRPVLWNGTPLDVGASVGAAIVGPLHAGQNARLFREADAALYAAKSAGQNTVRIFGDDGLGSALSPPRSQLAGG